MARNKYLIVISGPTAVGKTELCLKLAKKLNTEIISADSRQFFKEMELGTAKPSEEELLSVKHHFINNLSISEEYDVKKYEKDVLDLLATLFKMNDVVILTGGSGLYIDAVCQGFDEIPDIDPDIRKTIIQEYEENGLEWLQKEVRRLDPEYYGLVDLKNPQRLMRALEVCRGTDRPYSQFRTKKKQVRPFRIIKIALERDREELYQRIDLRMDQMIEKGLFGEAENLFQFKHLNALQTVGYSEIFGYLDGEYEREEAIRLLKRNSRRYAKRQLTWLKRDPDYHWFHPDDFEGIMEFIQKEIVRNVNG